MFCPIKHLSMKESPTDKCNPNCAWAIKDHGRYACAFAVLAAKGEELSVSYNIQRMPNAHERP